MKTHTLPISYALLFNEGAERAIQFYQSVFPDVTIRETTRFGQEGKDRHGQPEESVMAVSADICGVNFLAINGGPTVKINPSISFFILCDTPAEADKYWNALIEGGKVLMAIDKYDWSARYGWLQDQFGVSWQVYTRNERDSDQTIAPCLLFTGPYNGSSEEALHYYTTVFRNSETDGIMHYPPGSGDQEGKVMHSQFRLNGQIFMAMDGGTDHAFQFNDGVSFMIHCDTQEEIDYYWIQLTQGGEESQCGWLKDRFGVSWQVVPTRLMEMLMSPDRAQADRVVKAFTHMRKLDLAALEVAFEG